MSSLHKNARRGAISSCRIHDHIQTLSPTMTLEGSNCFLSVTMNDTRWLLSEVKTAFIYKQLNIWKVRLGKELSISKVWLSKEFNYPVGCHPNTSWNICTRRDIMYSSVARFDLAKLKRKHTIIRSNNRPSISATLRWREPKKGFPKHMKNTIDSRRLERPIKCCVETPRRTCRSRHLGVLCLATKIVDVER